MLVMNNAMLLLAAEHFSGETEYAACALDHLHYLLGRNVLGISYVTGFGEHAVMHPHHRPSVGDNIAEPVPGLVSGDLTAGCMMNMCRSTCKANRQPSVSLIMKTATRRMRSPFIGIHRRCS